MTFKSGEDEDSPGSNTDENWQEFLIRIDRIDARLRNLEQIIEPIPAEENVQSIFSFGGPKPATTNEAVTAKAAIRAIRPPLPDPRLVRKLIRQRQMRAKFFGANLFSDAVWDMLLDLTAARAEHKRVSVTSLCLASGVPPTTALRWLGVMAEEGLIDRFEDEIDRRRVFICLSDKAAGAMASYFAAISALPRT